MFSYPKVRKAFSLDIDRNYIIENTGGSCFSVADEDYEKNCEEARALLAEVGYPNGEGFPTVEYLYNTADNHKKIGEALQNMWQEQLGVTVTLNNPDYDAQIPLGTWRRILSRCLLLF